ncbi:hypothetical protein CMV_028280 [Castanea mollissima]|uniref:Uncharacterized protein n=1 Tax=Castanea mollissima TaxID=60419 RepID=A0A8J4Q844_9ROSI|nr:hypothetical protein CMV_028280 [Castanea mollissima]
MNDEDDDTDCEEVTNNISVRSSVVDQNDVSEELVEGLRDGSVSRAVHVDDHATHGQIVGNEDVHVDELDWLHEGYEGPNYLDDIFGALYNELPNMREHQRDTKNVNKGEHSKEPVTDNGKRLETATSDQAVNDNDWVEKALDDDDTMSINSSEDENERGQGTSIDQLASTDQPSQGANLVPQLASQPPRQPARRGVVPPRIVESSHLFSYRRGGGLRVETSGAMFSIGKGKGKDKDKGKVFKK